MGSSKKGCAGTASSSSPEPQPASTRTRVDSHKKAKHAANQARDANARKAKKDQVARRAKEKQLRKHADAGVEQDGDSEVVKSLRGASSKVSDPVLCLLLYSGAARDPEGERGER